MNYIRNPSVKGVLTGLVANLLVFVLLWPLFSVPRGSFVRPMSSMMLVLVVALVAVTGIPASWAGIKAANTKQIFSLALGFLGLVLCLAPVPFANVLVDIAAHQRGLIISK